jgi:hypothetical protein
LWIIRRKDYLYTYNCSCCSRVFQAHYPIVCLRVSQVFDISVIFLPLTVVPHAFRREATLLPPKSIMPSRRMGAPDLEMVA